MTKATFVGHISPLAAAVSTGVSVCAYIGLRSASSLALYTALSLGMLLLWQRAFAARRFVNFLRWMVPLVLPLLLVHGILNRGFPVGDSIFGFIPWRPDGFRFGSKIALNVLLFGTIASYWLAVSRVDVVDDLMRLSLPAWLILLLSQAVAMVGAVERRVESVYLAQRARGIPVGPGFIARIRAFPSVLVPTVVGIIVDAEGRAPALVSRGFASTRPAVPLARAMTTESRVFVILPFLEFLIAAFATFPQ